MIYSNSTMKATLKDISDRTGLSISTVSRILRGNSNSSDENVKKTIQIAQELNYSINQRLLNQQYDYKSKLQVALISSFFPEEFYSVFFYGLNNSARDENVALTFHIYDEEKDDLTAIIRGISNSNIDAAILFLPALQENDYKSIIQSVPEGFYIISMAPLFNPVFDTITFDSYRGGHIVAQHFHERSYKKLGIITGPNIKNEALLRKNGFVGFIEQQEELNLTWQYEGDYTLQSGADAFSVFDNLEEKPEAIFISNDYMCVGFLESAKTKGYNIPDDVALAGFDDLPICTYVYPSITSVHTDYSILGKNAFNLLKENVHTSNSLSGILSVIPVSLTVRDSS